MPNPLRVLSLLALLASPLAAQANATADLMSYGDVVGQQSELVATGMVPNAPVILLVSLQPGPNPYLVNQTGDPDDLLSVGLDLAFTGIWFSGVADAAGEYRQLVTLPAGASYLDREAWWQAFSNVGGGGAAQYDAFTRVRRMSLNDHDRWQAAGSDAPFPEANLAWSVVERGADNGAATLIFASGGGPALLTDELTPYPTSDGAWWIDAHDESQVAVAATMNDSRAFHVQVELADGRILVAGGVQGPYGNAQNGYFTKVLRSVEIYDPNTDAWTTVAPMLKYRAGANATLLPDGRVIVAGGTEGNSANEIRAVDDLLGTALKSTEIYDPATDTWVFGPTMPEFKAGAMAATLNDGRWLVAGGITHTLLFGIPIPDFSDNVSILDPTTMTWFNAGAKLKAKRALGGIAVLPGGSVYIAGGAGGDIFNVGPIAKTERYNPVTNISVAEQNLTVAVAFSTNVTMPDGSVLVVGGAKGDLNDPIPVANVWRFEPGVGVSSLASMPETHAGGVVELLEDGTVLVAGGESDLGTAVATSVSYTQ